MAAAIQPARQAPQRARPDHPGQGAARVVSRGKVDGGRVVSLGAHFGLGWIGKHLGMFVERRHQIGRIGGQ
jgi:hypothetical protein